MTSNQRDQVRSLFHVQKPDLIGYSEEQEKLIYAGFDMALNKAYALAEQLKLLPVNNLN